jgi:tetratricopeptide (TPR) repeat protein
VRSQEFWSWYDDFAAPRLKARAPTFRKMFEHLDSFDRPVHIVETGCVDDSTWGDDWDGNWLNNGCSTLLFDRYAHDHPGSTVRSVDIVPKRVRFAQGLVNGSCEIVCGDSVKVMADWAQDHRRDIDLVYLDASDLEWNHPVPSAQHHLNELTAIMPALTPKSMVAVDDSPATMDDIPFLQIGGKGEFVARYAFSVGADLEFLEYQAGWTNLTGTPSGDPVVISDLIARARAHVEGDRLVAADAIYRLVLSLTTQPPWSSIIRVARGEACAFFAKLALTKRRHGVASDWYRQALNADPAAVEYRIELAMRCYPAMGLLDAAAVELQRATEIAPDNGDAWRALGTIEHERREMKNAEVAYDKAIAVLLPGDPDAALDRATVALDLAQYDLVRELCQKAVGTRRAPDAMHILAMVACREARHEEAIELFDAAIAAGCHDPAIAHWHKSMAMESIGRWPEAWAERAYRKDNKARPALALPMRRFDAPLWDGEEGPGRVHVHAEAGSGDNLCMLRYLPLMVRRGLTVCYEGMPDMVDLVRHSMPEIEVVRRTPFYPDALGVKPFDWHCPIGQLQHAFRTSLKTVPWEGPYLKADPALAEQYRGKLPSKRNIGLCWSSGIRLNDSAWLAEYGRRKSMHFHKLAPILKLPLQFVSLQVGPEREQLTGWQAIGVQDVLPEHPTFADTAALIECLDLVITVDTAVAHLAGAMGKPTWVMAQRDAASWHFMCWRPGASWNERSPWYPSARVFRQHEFNKPHYWDDVVADVAHALTDM